MKKILLITVYLLLFTITLSGCIWKQPAITNEAAQIAPATPTTSVIPEKTFTLEELAKYDGKDGRPAYVVVDGLVYDLSSVFYQGMHYQHVAGKSLTKEFYSQHTKEALENYAIVGKLVE